MIAWTFLTPTVASIVAGNPERDEIPLAGWLMMRAVSRSTKGKLAERAYLKSTRTIKLLNEKPKVQSFTPIKHTHSRGILAGDFLG